MPSMANSASEGAQERPLAGGQGVQLPGRAQHGGLRLRAQERPGGRRGVQIPVPGCLHLCVAREALEQQVRKGREQTRDKEKSYYIDIKKFNSANHYCLKKLEAQSIEQSVI